MGVDAARTEATRFLALLGMRLGGWGCSWFPLQCRPGGRFRAAQSSSGGEACFPGAKRRAQQPAAAQARPPRAPGGLCRGGSSRAPLPASQRGWHRCGGSAGGSDPGAGRWAALAAAGRAVRGAVLEAAPLAAGEAPGGGTGLRSWGVSCVPARSPRRGRGPRRCRGRGRSTVGATSHEQRPRGRWPPLSPIRTQLAEPRHPLLSTPSLPEVRAGDSRRDGEGRPTHGHSTQSSRRAPARMRPPRLIRVPASSGLWDRHNVVACPACGPGSPPIPTPPNPKGFWGPCQGPPAWRLAQLDRTRFWGLGEGRTRRKRGRGRDGLGESPFSIPSKPGDAGACFFSFLFPTPLVSQECLKLHFFEEGGGNPWFPWGSNERQPAHLQDQRGGRGLLRIPRPGGQVSRPAVAARTSAFFPDRALLSHRFLWFPA